MNCHYYTWNLYWLYAEDAIWTQIHYRIGIFEEKISSGSIGNHVNKNVTGTRRGMKWISGSRFLKLIYRHAIYCSRSRCSKYGNKFLFTSAFCPFPHAPSVRIPPFPETRLESPIFPLSSFCYIVCRFISFSVTDIASDASTCFVPHAYSAHVRHNSRRVLTQGWSILFTSL